MRANDSYLKALNLAVVFSSRPDEVEIRLKANGVIGAVPLRAPDTHNIIGGIVVHPRFGWNSIGSLFSSIGWSASPEILSFPLVPGSAQEIPAWVIAGPAVAQLELLLRYSGPRFREITEVRRNPRGQIQWQKYCTDQAARGNFHLLPCAFSDLTADEQLRRYIKWALEKISCELDAVSHGDLFAHRLWERVQTIIMTLSSIRPLLPDHRSLDSMQRTLRQQTNKIDLGIEAIKWVLDERGLAGSSDLDGLSWRVRMHELFEQWVETLVRHWARGFGGRVLSGRKFESLSAIRWERHGVDSLSSLVPDVIVQGANETFVFDAKYKGFLDEVDELRWHETSNLMRDEHRHDLHQVLAYSSLYGSDKITVVLVYPLLLDTWKQLNHRGISMSKGLVGGPDRQVSVALVGVPVELGCGVDLGAITDQWNRLRMS